MTAVTKRGDPVDLPDTAQGFTGLVAHVDGLVVTEAIMVEAGADDWIAHAFFANFAPEGTIRVSELATFIASRHRDWRPAAIRAAHYVLSRNGVVLQPHAKQDCESCGTYIKQT
jgi:hypothetical protein